MAPAPVAHERSEESVTEERMMRCASVHTDGAGGHDWTPFGRSVPSACWAVLGSWEPASSNPAAEAPVEVLPCTSLLDLERYTSIGCGRGLIGD